MNNISLLLLTKNEQDNLKEWGSWIYELTAVNEIVVVDDESTDDTIKILNSLDSKKLSVNVFKRKLDNNFSNQRNFGLEKCQNDWILTLDADEKPSPNLIKYLNNLSPKNDYNYSFKRNIVYLGHTISHGQCQDDNPIKLFNKNEGQFVNPVHEVWKSEACTIDTHKILFHYSMKSLSTFLEKINFYSTIRAKELYIQNHHTNLFEIILYTKLKYINLFFIKLGFLDGLPGIILSLCLSFNSFLIRSKLWHLSQK